MEYNDSFFEKKYYAPTDVISGYQVRPGYYLRNGASVVEGGINFTVHSYGATSCNLCLFQHILFFRYNAFCIRFILTYSLTF